MRIGAKVPNSGPLPVEIGIPALARTLEAAGFESLWVSDHVVMPAEFASRYPFAADGRANWPSDTPYFDAIVSLALIAGATERAEFGTAVLVLPLRNAVIVAKQAASLDAASGGRLKLGLGAGWLAEEFDALGVPFEGRGARFEQQIAAMRQAWTGRLPGDVLAVPTPAHPVPLLIGGHSKPALRRAGSVGDGWLGQQSLNALDPAEIEAVAGAIGPEREIVLRIVDAAGRSDEVAAALPALARAGVREVIVDVEWGAGGDPARDFERIDVARG